MISVLFFTVHLVVPTLLIVWLWRRAHRGKLEMISHLLFTAAAVLLVSFWGQWPVVGSYYFRFLLPLLFLAAAAAVMKRGFSGSAVRTRGSMVLSGVFLVFLPLFGTLNLFAVRGHYLPQPGVELDFP